MIVSLCASQQNLIWLQKRTRATAKGKQAAKKTSDILDGDVAMDQEQEGVNKVAVEDQKEPENGPDSAVGSGAGDEAVTADEPEVTVDEVNEGDANGVIGADAIEAVRSLLFVSV
jgi:hypothetical protein